MIAYERGWSTERQRRQERRRWLIATAVVLALCALSVLLDSMRF